MDLVFNISKDLLYSNTRNRRGAFGRAVVGYLAKELANHPFKDTAAHFKRDPVVISKGIKGLEKRIGEDKTTITAINNDILEGINSLVQAAKAKARGYRTTKNLITMIYLIAGKLNFNLPT